MFKSTLIKIVAALSALAMGMGSFSLALAHEGSSGNAALFGTKVVRGTIGTIDPLNHAFTFSADDGRLFTVTTDAGTMIRNRFSGFMTFSDLRTGDRALILGTMSGSVIMAAKILTGMPASFSFPNDFRFRVRQNAALPFFFSDARFFPQRLFLDHNLADLRVREEFRAEPDRFELRIRQDQDIDEIFPDLRNRFRFEIRADENDD